MVTEQHYRAISNCLLPVGWVWWRMLRIAVLQQINPALVGSSIKFLQFIAQSLHTTIDDSVVSLMIIIGKD